MKMCENENPEEFLSSDFQELFLWDKIYFLSLIWFVGILWTDINLSKQVLTPPLCAWKLTLR